MKRLGWSLAFFIGFLSLSQEILWVRVVTFAHQGVPHSFALVLAVFLFGVASGATAGKRLCGRWPLSADTAVGWCLLAGGVLDLLVPWFVSRVAGSEWLSVTMGVLIYVSAALKAIAFPVAHHLGSDAGGSYLGRSVARVYALNIVGSTLGALLTGYVLLDHVSVSSGFTLVGTATLVMGLLSLRRGCPGCVWIAPVIVVGVIATADPDDRTLVVAASRHAPGRIKTIIENRHGIIHVVDDGEERGDVVYGGNVYDGRTNIDLRVNSNRVDRVYLLAALHPAPRKVLVIGLSTGAWARILSTLPSLSQMDVVEINPGYLSLISAYPHLSTLLNDRRVQVHIDDGRRWLRRHLADRFDLIVMNTTFHWRANITNLLSREFMEIARSRLAPGGIFAFNATGSADALATAAAVFPHAYRWSNFVYAAEHDFRAIAPQAVDRLAALCLGAEAFDLRRSTDRSQLNDMLAKPFVSVHDVEIESGRALAVITDANMLTEFKYGRRLRLD